MAKGKRCDRIWYQDVVSAEMTDSLTEEDLWMTGKIQGPHPIQRQEEKSAEAEENDEFSFGHDEP